MSQADKKILADVVRDMAVAQTTDHTVRHWADDVKWFDISAVNLHGLEAVRKEFDSQFSLLTELGADFVELDVHVSGDIGVVRSVQNFWAVPKSGQRIQIQTRQTDCFERRNGEWMVFHQHISLPQKE